jgi:hypothetical protein
MSYRITIELDAPSDAYDVPAVAGWVGELIAQDHPQGDGVIVRRIDVEQVEL